MNKFYLIGALVILLFIAAGNPPEKRVASRNYREIETVFIDSINPEKNYRRKEKIDAAGNVLETWEWNANGQLHQHVVVEVTADYELKTVYNALDTVVLIENTVYDNRGRKIKFTQQDRRKRRSENIVYTYNKWGEKSEERIVKNGKLTQIKRYGYDNQGLLTNLIITDSVGVIKSMKKVSYSK